MDEKTVKGHEDSLIRWLLVWYIRILKYASVDMNTCNSCGCLVESTAFPVVGFAILHLLIDGQASAYMLYLRRPSDVWPTVLAIIQCSHKEMDTTG